MSELLKARDCSPIPEAQRAPEVRDWLARLASAPLHAPHVFSFSESLRPQDEPIVYCERDGTWWCGRYIGELHFAGRTLRIEPRLGMPAIEHWLEWALGLVFTEVCGSTVTQEIVLPDLLARLWSRALVAAGRHGPPVLRSEQRHHGPVVRGQLDVRGTLQKRSAGRPGLSSLQRVRSLDNPVAQAIVAGYAALQCWLGRQRLGRALAERAQDLVDAMLMVIPRSAGPPTDAEVERVRYTPITAAYRPVVSLSMQLARRRGLGRADAASGSTTGVLFDVAELWELYVLACLRAAFPTAEVVHGSRDDKASDWLLTNAAGASLGRLKPDVLLRGAAGTVVVDAKYKRLHPSSYRPLGVERADLYQMAAYLSREPSRQAALVYPEEPGGPAEVVRHGPWRFGTAQTLRFVTLPLVAVDAVSALRAAPLWE